MNITPIQLHTRNKMPIREYRCSECQHQWEELRKGQTHAEECPKCQAKKPLALLTSAALQFKGAGWWSNDKHNYEPSKQIILRGDGTTVEPQDPINHRLVTKDWTPPK